MKNIKVKYLSIIILFCNLFAYNTLLKAQIPNYHDPVSKMHDFFLAQNFGTNLSVSFIPVIIQNATEFDLEMYSTDTSYKNEKSILFNTLSFTHFPVKINANSTGYGYVYNILHLNMEVLVGANNQDYWIQYKFNNSYNTPFIFHFLCRQKDIDYKLNHYNGAQSGLKTVRAILGLIKMGIPIPGAKAILGVFQVLIGVANLGLTIDNLVKYGRNFYFLAYPYSDDSANVTLPALRWECDSLNHTSTNAVTISDVFSRIDTGFVTENVVVWDSDEPNFYNDKNAVGYYAPKILVNIYTSWVYFSVHPKVMAENIKNSPGYNEHPKVKKLVDDILEKGESGMMSLYSEIGYDKARKTSKFLEEYFSKEVTASSPDLESRVDEILKFHKLK